MIKRYISLTLAGGGHRESVLLVMLGAWGMALCDAPPLVLAVRFAQEG